MTADEPLATEIIEWGFRRVDKTDPVPHVCSPNTQEAVEALHKSWGDRIFKRVRTDYESTYTEWVEITPVHQETKP